MIYRMEFPIGKEPNNKYDPYVSVDMAIDLVSRHQECSIEAPDGLVGLNALIKPELKRLGVGPWEYHTLQYYIDLYPSLEEYLIEGYVKWKGGYGCMLVVTKPIPDLPFRIQLYKKRGRDSTGSWTRTVIQERNGEIITYHWHEAHYTQYGPCTWIRKSPPPIVAVEYK